MAQRKKSRKVPAAKKATETSAPEKPAPVKVPATAETLVKEVFDLKASPDVRTTVAFRTALAEHLSALGDGSDLKSITLRAQLGGAQSRLTELEQAIVAGYAEAVRAALAKAKVDLRAGVKLLISTDPEGNLQVSQFSGGGSRAKRGGGSGPARQVAGGAYKVAGIGDYNSFSSSARAVSQVERPELPADSTSHSINGWAAWKRVSDGLTPKALRDSGGSNFDGTYEFMGRTLTVTE